ncbi:calcium-binding protein [Thioclava sp.]|uniref:calcium-binding protein n=1 Tax=Thioclava sp. TaxID=1933450 RepID=UPI003241FC18
MLATLLLAFLPMALLVGASIDGGGDHKDDHEDEEAARPDEEGTGAGEEIDISEPDQVTEGTSGDDTIRGTDGTDTVMGLAGDDDIYLGDGNDGGDLSLEDELAMDQATSLGDFLDAFEASGVFGAVGGSGDDYIDAGAGNDSITGSQGDDTLRGNLGADYLFDAEGSNALYGGYGDDELYASDLDGAPDLLDGGANNDYLNGDDGDTMIGGTGSDWFGVDWTEGDAPVTVTDFGQLDPTPAPGALGEFLGIEVDDLDNVSDFTVSQSGSDSIVSINGQQVATLKDVEYTALKAAGGAIYATDGLNYGQPVYA